MYDQLTKHDPESGQVGDCIRACIASILDIHPQGVPNFSEYQGPLAWWDKIREFLRSNHELDVTLILSLDDVISWGDALYAVASVDSPRGPWQHCVVVDRDNNIVHDPYPDDKMTGKAKAHDYFMIVEPYNPFPTIPIDYDAYNI